MTPRTRRRLCVLIAGVFFGNALMAAANCLRAFDLGNESAGRGWLVAALCEALLAGLYAERAARD